MALSALVVPSHPIGQYGRYKMVAMNAARSSIGVSLLYIYKTKCITAMLKAQSEYIVIPVPLFFSNVLQPLRVMLKTWTANTNRCRTHTHMQTHMKMVTTHTDAHILPAIEVVHTRHLLANDLHLNSNKIISYYTVYIPL